MADVKVLERGDLFLFYTPVVNDPEVEGVGDVQRLYMVMRPQKENKYRFIIVGQKVLPTIEQKGATRRNWAFVDFVTKDASKIREQFAEKTYETKTEGTQHRGPARPAAEGRYNITTHGDHTHLAYVLELPVDPGLAQQELRVKDEASYLISIKNPERAAPAAGLDEDRQADFPAHLQKLFGGNKWGDVRDTRLLDYPGAEILLIGASTDVEEELGIKIKTEDEDRDSAEIFDDLHIDAKNRPLEPLFEGDWR